MNNVRFIKSFSKGQITIPKEFRDIFGMHDEFWLKVWTEDGKIIAEPIEKKIDKVSWKKKLLRMSQIEIDQKVIQKNKDNIEKQIKSRSL